MTRPRNRWVKYTEKEKELSSINARNREAIAEKRLQETERKETFCVRSNRSGEQHETYPMRHTRN